MHAVDVDKSSRWVGYSDYNVVIEDSAMKRVSHAF